LKTELSAEDRERLRAFLATLPEDTPVQERDPEKLGEASPE